MMQHTTHAVERVRDTAGDTATDRTGLAPHGGAAAPRIEPVQEDAYWRENYDKRPYVDETVGYDQYRPAYRYGWESRARFSGRRWDEVQRDLERDWRAHRGQSRLGWSEARQAARDAWQRIDRLASEAREQSA